MSLKRLRGAFAKRRFSEHAKIGAAATVGNNAAVTPQHSIDNIT
jgi:hypothetical protein